jgi:hypothetical protein
MSTIFGLPLSRSLLLTMGIALLMVAISPIAWHWMEEAKQTSDSLRRAKSLVDILWQQWAVPTKIVIEGKTVVERQSPIAQLATAETTITESYAVRTTWLGSEKRFHVRARFTGKAGYDLQEAFVIDLAAHGSRATVTLPPPRLLSVEQAQLEILEDESGYWNRLDATQRAAALEQLHQKARASLLESGILAQAQSSLEKQFADVLRQQLPSGLQLNFLVSP